MPRSPQGCVLRYCLFWAQIHLLAGDIAAHFSRKPPASRRVWVSTVLRYLKFRPRIQAVIPQNAAHTTEPAVSTHTHRYSLPPSGSRQHSPAPAGVSKVVCCDIWIFGRVWDPICEISQHSIRQTTQTPNHRSVTWFTNQFDAPQPPGMCAAILPVLGPDSPPGGRYRSTLL